MAEQKEPHTAFLINVLTFVNVDVFSKVTSDFHFSTIEHMKQNWS